MLEEQPINDYLVKVGEFVTICLEDYFSDFNGLVVEFIDKFTKELTEVKTRLTELENRE